MAAAGEPFKSFLEPEDLLRDATALGFSFVEDLDADALNRLYFSDRNDGLALRGRGHLLHARV